jgi:tetraacyldisaccharide 4'-kinase
LKVLTLPDQILSRSSFTAEFPLDKPTFPAPLTVPLSAVYRVAADFYHHHISWKRAYRAPVPVISVGNLVVGGTGKTPCTIALARMITDMEPSLAEPNRLAVLSRGFGRASSDLVVVEEDSDYHQTGDEPLLIKRSVPTLAVLVHVLRNKTAQYAVRKLGSRLLLLDDAFQNRGMARDLDLVLLDGKHPFGNGRVLPAGPLREGKEALKRATAIIGVGSDFSPAAEVAARYGKPFVGAVPRLLLPEEILAESAAPVYLLTSIARPSRFFKMLAERGITVVGGEAFGDHHRFTRKEIAGVAEGARRKGAKYILTTGKDRTRIRDWNYDLPLLVADLNLEFVQREEMQKLVMTVVKTAAESIRVGI